MKYLSNAIFASVVILSTLVMLHQHSHSATYNNVYDAPPCTSEAISVPFQNLDQLNAFGCQELWAWVYATVAPSPGSVGVTEILKWNPNRGTWQFANRSIVCSANYGQLPKYIYLRGCFSN